MRDTSHGTPGKWIGLNGSNATSVPFAWMAGICVWYAAAFNGQPLRSSSSKFVRLAREETSDTSVYWRPSVSKCVRCASEETSETSVLWRYSHSKFVRLAREDTSETKVPVRSSHLKFVRLATADTSETKGLVSSSVLKFVRCASAETSDTPVEARSSHSKFVRDARGDTLDIGFSRHSPSIVVAPRSNHVRLTAYSRPVRFAIPRPFASSRVKLRSASDVIAAPGGKPRASRRAAAKLASGMNTTSPAFSTWAVVFVTLSKSVVVKSSAKTVMRFFFICVDFLVSWRGNGFGRVARGFG